MSGESVKENNRAHGLGATLQKNGIVLLAAGLSLLLFALALIRAAGTEITYDESFTYLNYVRGLSFDGIPALFASSQTNNHLLNTLLIWVVQVVSGRFYNEFLIRLPNLLFYMGFLGLCAWMLAKRAIPFWGWCLLALNVHLHEFFGLARGYGMAAALVLAGLYFYGRWCGDGRFWQLTLCFGLFALGGLAITYVMVVLLGLGLCALWQLVRQKRLAAYIKSQWLLLVPVAVLCLLAVAYQMLCGRNTPFAPGGVSGLFAFYRGFFVGFCASLWGDGTLALVAGAALCLWFCLSAIFFYKKLLASVFALPFLANIAVWTVVSLAGSFIPLGRGYLIFYPLMVLAFVEVAQWQWAALGQKLADVGADGTPTGESLAGRLVPRLASLAVCAVLAVLFAAQASPHQTRDWRENYGIRSAMQYIYAHRIEAEDLSASSENTVHFYRDKILYKYGYDIFTGQMVEGMGPPPP